jgi:3-deoxy-D-manno-octulosonic-acid transferase
LSGRAEPISLRLYAAATAMVEPLAPTLLRERARRGKEEAGRLGERLGQATMSRPEGPLVWLHGASVGESLSLLPLIEALDKDRPDLALLITTGTRTSAELMAQRLPITALHQYVPIDGPRAVEAFLDHWRPDLAVFVESELWPNLLTAAKARGVRLALLSAKLSNASFRGWSRLRGAAARLWGGFDLVLAQDERSFERLRALGVKPAGLADLKFGAKPLPVNLALLNDLRSRIGERPVILAASTHPREEEIVLQRFAAAADTASRAARRPLLVIAPRHPERGAAIAEAGETQGFRVTRQGVGESIDDDAPVHVADALGELGLWYRLAELSVIGGSLIAGVGGHNPLEPARLGRPFVAGAHVENWRTAYRGLAEAGGVGLATTPETLDRYLTQAIDRNDALVGMARRAQAYVAQHDEAVRAVPARVLALLR